ncbi:predicted protein [Plenodomus lingam JN3]|uniref:Predicted protein n=2 Tax=Leptosphaeria maculans TaxID=5022 RepID=E5A993_LEPMJ|nr:predicted protein [Plenodomus lingam JN3]CBY00234.1 predicted protein [Plenodomus lingam JN3]
MIRQATPRAWNSIADTRGEAMVENVEHQILVCIESSQYSSIHRPAKDKTKHGAAPELQWCSQ